MPRSGVGGEDTEREPALVSEGASSTAKDSPSKGRYRLPRQFTNPKALGGLVVLLAFAMVALLAPVFAPGDPNQFVDQPNLAPSALHWLGTSGQGQEIARQVVWGSRSSLMTGLIVGLLATAIGTFIGLTAAYLGRWVDDLLSLLMNIFLIVPGLPLLVVLAAFLPAGEVTTVLVLTVTGWAWTARVMRAQALSIREKDFVVAALISGAGSVRIMLREILPNMTSIVVGALLGSIVYGIGAQATLQFLGLGNISDVSWGTILYWADNNAALLTGAWWTFVPAGLCIAVVAFALTMLNYAMDEVTNPRLHVESETARVFKKVAFRPGRATSIIPRPE